MVNVSCYFVGGGHGFLRLYGHKSIFADVYIYAYLEPPPLPKNTRSGAPVWLLFATADTEKRFCSPYFSPHPQTYWQYDHELVGYINAPTA